MLNKLDIKNVALIDEASIEFTDGLNILSGETGSGKSVILESLNYVLGAKADKSLIRNGTEECYVCAEFDITDNENIKTVFNEYDFDYDDTLIITRKFNIDGKSSIRLNGMPINVTVLKKFTSGLVDIHGQSDHYRLLSETNQLKLIDTTDQLIDNKKSALKDLYSEYKSTKTLIEEFGGDKSQRAIKLDIIDYQINEITNAELSEDEEDNLIKAKQKIQFQEKIINALSSIKSAIGDEGGISDILSNVVKNASYISDISSEYADIYDRLNDLYEECSDIESTTLDLLENFDMEEIDVDYIEKRLDLIKNLKKKYGSDYAEIMQFLHNISEEREKLINFAEENERLNLKIDNLKHSIYIEYSALSELRRKASIIFCEKVQQELTELGMSKAQFDIKFSDPPSFDDCKFDSPNGFDRIEFLFSANSGESVKPLSAVISGGEMSRFMLSVKAQSAKYGDTETYIFDEIDAGISGHTASVVAKKLFAISTKKQVIAITHLPQISVFADNNVLITKTEGESSTVTTVKKLSYEEKISEITRLVGGSSDSVAAKQHALEMIKEAEKIKTQLKIN